MQRRTVASGFDQFDSRSFRLATVEKRDARLLQRVVNDDLIPVCAERRGESRTSLGNRGHDKAYVMEAGCLGSIGPLDRSSRC